MPTLIGVHEVEDGAHWANAWKQGAGSRHELFGQVGVKARTFRDPENPEFVAVLMDVPDMDAFGALLDSDEGKQAMAEDKLKVETLRLLHEFTP